MSQDFTIEIRFHPLSEQLQPYFTALYSFTVECDDGVMVRDMLHPEWAVVRFLEAGAFVTEHADTERGAGGWQMVATGPSGRAVPFGIRRTTMWGFGLQPVGWAKYIDAPAADLADRVVDGRNGSAFAIFEPILRLLDVAPGDLEETGRLIDTYLMELEPRPVPSEDRILACCEALRDFDVANVDELAEKVGVGRRTLERLCARYFGFSPKQLLRRQRLLRSLVRFVLDPQGGWIKALDGQYFDQAHFVRDFRSFMGMSPRQYAEMPHPVIEKVINRRMADHGVTAPDESPLLLRYAGKAMG